MKILDIIAWILLIVGGLNWGLVALNYNAVDMIFGAGTTLDRVVYGLVGLAAIYTIFRRCQGSSCCK